MLLSNLTSFIVIIFRNYRLHQTINTSVITRRQKDRNRTSLLTRIIIIMILMQGYRNCSSRISACPTASVITTSLNFYSQQQQKSTLGSHRNVLMSTIRSSPFLTTAQFIFNFHRCNHHHRNEHRLVNTLYEKYIYSNRESPFAFISNSPYNNHQQQSYFSTVTKKQRTSNRWRSPILQQPKTSTPTSSGTASKRKPKIYKRTYLRNKKNDNDDLESMIQSDGKLYRADRVLANRTGKSRKECFQLLHDRRVFIVTDQLYNDASTSTSSSSSALPKQQQLLHSNNQLQEEQPKGMDTNANNDAAPTSADTDDNESNIIQQYRLEVITGPSMKIGMNTNLRIDKYQSVPLPPPLLMIYHKPKWVLSVRRDPRGRPCLDDIFLGNNTEVITKNPNAVPPLHPVGRLDYDTSGLLLFSSSGPLTQSLLHPKHAIEKEYVAVVTGIVNVDELRNVLAAGVTTGEGIHTANLVSAFPNTPPSDEVSSYLANIKAGLPSEYNTTDLKARGYLDVLDATSLSTVTLTVSEGKYRMVRRILANVGHPVVSLHRTRLGEIELGNVPIGETRPLTINELKWAKKQLKESTKSNSAARKKKVEEFENEEDL